MAIQYQLSKAHQTLVVTASGFDESLEDVLHYGQAIIAEGLSGDYTAVLCDERQLEYRIGTLDTLKAAEFIAQYAPRLAKAAIVCGAQFIQDARFWENVAVNRGFTTVRVFKDIEAAKNWLDE